MSLNMGGLFIPMGRGALSVGLNFLAFYVIAAPAAGVLALTNLVTTDVATKMMFCVGELVRGGEWRGCEGAGSESTLSLPVVQSFCLCLNTTSHPTPRPGATSLAQIVISILGLAILSNMDWAAGARVINERAHTDKTE